MMTSNGSWNFSGSLFSFFCAAFVLAASLAHAQETVTVTSLTGPLSFQAASGSELVLPGLIAPDLPETRAAISTFTLNQPLNLQTLGTDRWGRTEARLTTPDGKDIAEELLKAGWAQSLIATPAEAAARAARRGLWALPCCKVMAADGTIKTDGWRIISGRVQSVSARRDLTFVNFGPDWKTDFTVMIPVRLARQMQPETLTGKNIEVRGWVEWYYGPAIKLTDAAQIQLQDAAK